MSLATASWAADTGRCVRVVDGDTIKVRLWSRRYERRWLVERFFAWIQWHSRLLVGWEYYAENFLGFVQLASIAVLLKQF